jgi:uncharacterized protein
MAIVYFDSSALVKLLVEEDGTDLASQLWDGCDAALSSRLAYPEVRAALAAAHRNRTLDAVGLEAALTSWEEFWSTTRPVELRAEVEQHAGELAQRHSLRGADAVHLASAMTVPANELVVAVWDRRLHAGATAEGLATSPATL